MPSKFNNICFKVLYSIDLRRLHQSKYLIQFRLAFPMLFFLENFKKTLKVKHFLENIAIADQCLYLLGFLNCHIFMQK